MINKIYGLGVWLAGFRLAEAVIGRMTGQPVNQRTPGLRWAEFCRLGENQPDFSQTRACLSWLGRA